ncbi:MAG: helix-turn-helix domain-containing protein [bacterium]
MPRQKKATVQWHAARRKAVDKHLGPQPLSCLYLGGPAGRHGRTTAMDWRAWVTFNLPGTVTIVPPQMQKMHVARSTQRRHRKASADQSPRSALARIRVDAKRCQAALFNFLDAPIAEREIVEMIEFSAARTPIIVCMNEENPHRHDLVCGAADFLVPSLEQGMAIARKLLVSAGPPLVPPSGRDLGGLEELERWAIHSVLVQTNGNRSSAARYLGINRNTLLRKIHALNVPLKGIPNRRGRKP